MTLYIVKILFVSSFIHVDRSKQTADESDWKRIQQKTFTRWCNRQLKVQHVTIEDLSEAFCDGVALITLMEVLSGKSVGRYCRKPKVHAQKVDNVSKVLDFIMKDERIKLVNIGSVDIVTPNLKLILGLVWTLILHYQISHGFGFDLDDPATEEVEGPSAKQALLRYVRQKLPNKTVNNLTTDWNDGILIASLVDAHAPGLCTEVDTMDPSNALENATLAMKRAEQWLDVPQLLEPQDMVNPKIDELSMMTYLSQFLEATLKPGAPLKPRVEPSIMVECMGSVKANGKLLCEFIFHKTIANREGGEVRCLAEHVRLGGQGLKGGCIGESLSVTVDMAEAGAGDLRVSIEGPQGAAAAAGADSVVPAVAACTFEKDTGAAHLNLTFFEAGVYKVETRYGNQEVPSSPHHVEVWDPSLVSVYGSGITGVGTSVGLLAEVFVDCRRLGTVGARSDVQVTVRGPGSDAKVVSVCPMEGGDRNILMGSYVPSVPGVHWVSVMLHCHEVMNSPFKARICDLSKIQLGGPGLSQGVVDASNTIDIYTTECKEDIHWGPWELAGKIGGGSPHGRFEGGDFHCHCVPMGVGHYQLVYTPHREGLMEANVTCGGVAVPHAATGSGLTIPCIDPRKAVISGTGIKSGVMVGEVAQFVVDARRCGPGEVKVLMTGPVGESVQVQIAHEGENNGVCRVTYQPTVVGEHIIGVTFGGLQVSKSPYKVRTCDPKEVMVSGEGIKQAIRGVKNVIEVRTSKAGMNEVEVEFEGNAEVECHCTDIGEGRRHILYTPDNVGKLKMVLKYFCEDTLVASQDFDVPCIDPTAVVVDWKGLGHIIPIGEARRFSVDTTRSGARFVEASLSNQSGETVRDVSIEETSLGQYIVSLKTYTPGVHRLVVKCGDTLVPGCPYNLTAFDPKAIKVYGPGLEQAIVGADNTIEVDTKEAGASGGDVDIAIEGPSLEMPTPEYEIRSIGRSHHKISYVPLEVGMYEVTVLYAGFPIYPKARVPCINPSSITVDSHGNRPNLVVGVPVDLKVNTSGAGPGLVGVAMVDPKGEKVLVEVEETDCGVYNITFVPSLGGGYSAGLTFGGVEVEGSPFVTQVCNPSSVAVRGPGVERAFAMETNEFLVDSSRAGDGSLNITIEGPEECTIDCRDNSDHTYCVSYMPTQVGTYNVNIKFANLHIPGSPFLVECSRAPPDASKCLATLHPKDQVIVVDARNGGGTGALEVGVWGTQNPARHVGMEHNGDYTFNVSYDIPEVGEAEISIKWHGQHIRGSPFKVVMSREAHSRW